MQKDLTKIARKASIALRVEDNSLHIKSKFALFNRFNIGVLVFLALGVFLIAVAIVKTKGIDTVILLSIGIVVLIVFLLVIGKQFTDFLFVTDKEIVFRNSWQKRAIEITPDLKVKTLIERNYINTARSGAGSYSRSVEIFIEKDKVKYRVVDFIMEDDDTNETDYLYKTIAHFIKKKIEDARAHNR